MRKIILQLAVSLDGMIEGPNGEYDWCFSDGDYGMQEFLTGIDTVLYGRKSYELMTKPGMDNPFTNLRSYVYSRTFDKTSDGYELVNGDAAAHARKLKKEKGKNIWLFGGASLTKALMDAHLVDEIWLAFHPVVLGAGKPLFEGLNERAYLRLTHTKTYETGLINLRYEIDRQGDK